MCKCAQRTDLFSRIDFSRAAAQQQHIFEQVTDEELASYEPIDFELEEYKKDVGVESLLHDNKAALLMHRWRFPSLSLHGIEGLISVLPLFHLRILLKVQISCKFVEVLQLRKSFCNMSVTWIFKCSLRILCFPAIFNCQFNWSPF